MATQFAMPKVGSKVRVTIRTKDDFIFATSPFKDQVFEGTILNAESWVRATSFCMTGDKNIRVREIPIDLVTNLEYLDGSTAAKVDVDNEIQVKQVPGSKPGVFYTVTKVGSKVTCSCPGFGFRKKCRHCEMI